VGLLDGLGATSRAEFAVQVFDVGAYGILGNEEQPFDLLIGNTSGNELEDFAFAGSELDERSSESRGRKRGCIAKNNGKLQADIVQQTS
jgi:hypothetical protein